MTGDMKENGAPMEEPGTATRFGERYEIHPTPEGNQDLLEVIDQKPWLRCWSCGSTRNEAEEAFCIDCGADLYHRRYKGIVTSETDGLALVASLEDDQAREMLPPVWDQVEEGDHRLIVLSQNDASPVTLPLTELAAFRVGLALSRLLVVLHRQHLELGVLVPSDLGLTESGQPRLLRVENLRRMNDDEREEAIRSDIQALAGLLESLTSIPRKTQRLDNETVPVSPSQPVDIDPDLSVVLREIRTGMLEQATDLVRRLENVFDMRTRPTFLRQNIGSSTHTGMVRDHNEDSLLAMKLTMNNTSFERTWGIFIVADGMGGHAGGEVASGLAIRRAAEVLMNEYLARSLDPDELYNEEAARDLVHQAVLQANETVRQDALTRGNDMGTTLTMALVVGDRAIVANVGDSRTYLYRDGKLSRISKDHSLVMRLVELGQIRDSDIYIHPQRNAVLRSLGDRPSIEIDIFTRRLRSGDALLLCSDGQWEMTHDPEMEEILASCDDPNQACYNLIAAANKAGGEDNITSVLVRFV